MSLFVSLWTALGCEARDALSLWERVVRVDSSFDGMSLANTTDDQKNTSR
jgi:hypothetical protein